MLTTSFAVAYLMVFPVMIEWAEAARPSHGGPRVDRSAYLQRLECVNAVYGPLFTVDLKLGEMSEFEVSICRWLGDSKGYEYMIFYDAT